MNRYQMMAGAAQHLAGQGGFMQWPVIKMARKYWWASIPIGMTVYGKIKERRSELNGKMKFHQYVIETADVLAPFFTILSVIELADRMQEEGKLDPVANVQHAAVAQPQPQARVPMAPKPAGTMEPPAPSLQQSPQGHTPIPTADGYEVHDFGDGS